MYIAFKWLISLSLIMWVSMCFVDCFMKGTLRLKNTGVYNKQMGTLLKNISEKNDYKTKSSRKDQSYNKDQSLPFLYLSMFMAGALTVSAFHKKKDIIIFARNKISTRYLNSNIIATLREFKKSALKYGVTISQYLLCLWENIKIFSLRIQKTFKVRNPAKQNRIHLILLTKLKELGEERKNLGQLLIAAIQENKNIRMRYQLETLTKNRLVQHIENTQKEIKENRSKYVSFQQLYLVTHQENNFLKARVRKLKKDKDDAEMNLMSLINEVYRSSNKELKAYCTRFIVKTRDNLLNSDVNAEITEFLEKNSSRVKRNNNNKLSTHNWPDSRRITEVSNEDDSLVALVSDAPKLKGLPGEYVWTVKDKNGIIEKLYEYDFESSLDNGDIIKRIRQYSVYYDKDCLLDFSKLENESEADILACSSRSNILDHPSNPRLVTGSEAFQKFLKINNSLMPTKSSSTMLCL